MRLQKKTRNARPFERNKRKTDKQKYNLFAYPWNGPAVRNICETPREELAIGKMRMNIEGESFGK